MPRGRTHEARSWNSFLNYLSAVEEPLIIISIYIMSPTYTHEAHSANSADNGELIGPFTIRSPGPNHALNATHARKLGLPPTPFHSHSHSAALIFADNVTTELNHLLALLGFRSPPPHSFCAPTLFLFYRRITQYHRWPCHGSVKIALIRTGINFVFSLQC